MRRHKDPEKGGAKWNAGETFQKSVLTALEVLINHAFFLNCALKHSEQFDYVHVSASATKVPSGVSIPDEIMHRDWL